MMPVFSLSALSVQFAPMETSLPVQAVGFEALLSVTTVPAFEPVSAPPPAKENVKATVVIPEVDVDSEIMPLLAAFGGAAAPHTISAVSQSSEGDQASIAESESVEAEPVQNVCAEIAVSLPIIAPTIVPNITPVTVPTAVLPPKVQKSGAPVMDRDRNTELTSASVPNVSTKQPAQVTPAQASPADRSVLADVAELMVSIPVESNSVTGSGFQSIMADRIADAVIRPLTDAGILVADRALDVARGSLWLDQLAGDIAAVQDHDRDLTFRMIPAQLGQLDVKIATRDDGMQLNFNTQTEAAAQIIGSAQSRLVEELKAQGVRVAGSEVNAGSGQSSFAQQNGQPPRTATIAEFERPSSGFPESTPPNEPQNGRFA